jgi:hypothetical protein
MKKNKIKLTGLGVFAIIITGERVRNPLKSHLVSRLIVPIIIVDR